jgi:ParB/RepB/Spo0J family partition protein
MIRTKRPAEAVLLIQTASAGGFSRQNKMMDLEFAQLDRRYEKLRIRKPVAEKRLLASLAQTGQRVPIVVVAGSGAGEFIVVDGYKRVRALEQLRYPTVTAMQWQIGEMEAILMDRFLRGQQTETPLEQGWLLAEMNLRFGLKLQELALRVGRSASWVSRRLGLVKDLPTEITERVRRGQIVAHAAMKYLLPLARANPRQCVQIAEGIAGKAITSRQVAQLYAVWRDGSPQIRERLAADPMLFLRTQDTEGPPRTGLTSLLRRDIDIVTATARRATHRFKECAGKGLLLPCEAEELREQLQTAARDLERLDRQIKKEIADAQTPYASGDPGTGPSGP